MLRHLEELFYPVPTKILYLQKSYGEYQKEFDEFPSNVELMGGFPDNLSDMVRGHDNFGKWETVWGIHRLTFKLTLDVCSERL